MAATTRHQHHQYSSVSDASQHHLGVLIGSYDLAPWRVTSSLRPPSILLAGSVRVTGEVVRVKHQALASVHAASVYFTAADTARPEMVGHSPLLDYEG